MHFFDLSTKTAIDRAVDLPDFFSDREKLRSYRSSKFIVSDTAKSLRDKHKFLVDNGWEKGIDVSDVESEMRKGYIRVLVEEGSRPIVYFLRRNFVPRARTARMQLADESGMTTDRSSSMGSAIHCVVYCMELVVKEMEDLPTDQDGFIAILDFDGCGVKNFEFPNHAVDREIFSMLSRYYPETVYKMFVANANNIVLQGVSQLARSLLPPETREKLEVLPPNRKDALEVLCGYVPRDSLPRSVGGLAEYENVDVYIENQAKREGIDLKEVHRKRAEASEELMNGDGLALNGMQYSGMGAEEALKYKYVLRGSLWWFKDQGASEIKGRKLNILARLGLGWSEMFVLLRPDACLIYYNPSSKTPSIIIPLAEVEVRTIKIDSQPKNSYAFSMSVPGSPKYILATKSEQERARWLQGIEEGKSSCKQREEERTWAEEEHARMNGDLLGLDEGDSGNVVYGGFKVAAEFPQFQQQGNGDASLVDIWGSSQPSGTQSAITAASTPPELSATSSNEPSADSHASPQLWPSNAQPSVQHPIGQQPTIPGVLQQLSSGQISQNLQPREQPATMIDDVFATLQASSGQPSVSSLSIGMQSASISSLPSPAGLGHPGIQAMPHASKPVHPNTVPIIQGGQNSQQVSNETRQQLPQHYNYQQRSNANQEQHSLQQRLNVNQQHHSLQHVSSGNQQHTLQHVSSRNQQYNLQQEVGATQQSSHHHLVHGNPAAPQQNVRETQTGVHQAHHIAGMTQREIKVNQAPQNDSAGGLVSTRAPAVGESVSPGVTVPQAIPVLFPAGMSGTPEYGQHWVNLPCLLNVQVLRNSNTVAETVIATLWKGLNVQHVETLKPAPGREFYEAILAGRSSTDGSVCLLHTKLEKEFVVISIKSNTDQLCQKVATRCSSQWPTGL